MGLKIWCSYEFKKKGLENSNSKNLTKQSYLSQVFLNLILVDFFFKKNKLLFYCENELFFNFIKLKLPFNFNFEIKKTIEYFLKVKKINLYLQLPDGLECFSVILVNVLESTCFGMEKVWIGSRTTYGACCIEDYLTKSIGGNFILHYGHSCLVPITECMVSVLFIFLEIKFDFSFIGNTFKQFFPEKKPKVGLVSTIQFVSSLKSVKNGSFLEKYFILIPQIKPLSPGEILGCTSPYLENLPNIIYIGDGRFHLESIILTNIFSQFLQFDPFSQTLNLVGHKTVEILQERKSLILKSVSSSKKIGLIIGSLGRQGNLTIMRRLSEIFEFRNLNKIQTIMPEISLDKLDLLGGEILDLWTQIACPRLSIDWGSSLPKPLLTPYEASTLFRFVFWENFFYPMDYYSKKSGFWTNYSKTESNFIPKSFFKKIKLRLYIFYSVSHFKFINLFVNASYKNSFDKV